MNSAREDPRPSALIRWGKAALPLGLVGGVAIGAGLGAALGNIAIGTAIGAGLGLGVGIAATAAAYVFNAATTPRS